MANTLSLRPDAEIEDALRYLGTDYGNRTDTVKAAILELARKKRSEALRAETLAAASDPADLAETREVMKVMDGLRAW